MTPAPSAAPSTGRRPPAQILRSLTRSPGALVGAVLVGLFVFTALFGPWLAPYDPHHQDLEQTLKGPSWSHPLGTDENGCDLLSEVLYGARLALIIAGVTVSISLTLGILLGSLAGYAGGWLDEAVMRIVDLLLAFPGILLNLAVVALVARPTTGYLIFALCLNGWVGFARVARGQVLTVKRREFVLSAEAAGAAPPRILFRHIIPHILPPLLVQASFAVAAVVLTEAALSFLGLGPPHHYSWGSLLGQGTAFMWLSHHLALIPAACIGAVVLGCNLLGDTLQQRLDPTKR
jgi:peptide/nickel transport system permease protein